MTGKRGRPRKPEPEFDEHWEAPRGRGRPVDPAVEIGYAHDRVLSAIADIYADTPDARLMQVYRKVAKTLGVSVHLVRLRFSQAPEDVRQAAMRGEFISLVSRYFFDE
jgi:hypothetical protein